MTEQPLAGKVAVVTGGGRGVGRAEALELASRGAAVVVNDIGSTTDGAAAGDDPAAAVVDEICRAGARGVANSADVASMDGAASLIAQAIDAFGRLDILVNNAGILRDRMVFNMSEGAWDDVIRIHLKGHFAPTRQATAYWRERARQEGPVAGRIINTSSSAGLFGNAGQANYAAAKAGIAAFSLVVAREMAKYGVTSNTICPIARTRLMTQGTAAHGGAPSADTGSDGWDPLDPANVASLVGFLAGPGSGHLTGQVFIVGAGRLQLADGWRIIAEVRHDAPPDPVALEREVLGLFAGRFTQPPPFAEARAFAPTAATS